MALQALQTSLEYVNANLLASAYTTIDETRNKRAGRIAAQPCGGRGGESRRGAVTDIAYKATTLPF